MFLSQSVLTDHATLLKKLQCGHSGVVWPASEHFVADTLAACSPRLHHPVADMACSGQFDISHSFCDFLHGMKWKHQSTKPLSNQSAV